MSFSDGPARKQILLIAGISLSLIAGNAAGSQSSQPPAGQQPSAQASSAARLVGTIKSIFGNAIILTTDTGSDVTVQVQDAAKLVRIAPGQKDLKDATPIQLADLQPGDLGGLVTSIDAAGNTINVSLPSPGEKKTVAIHLSKDTILRRYVSDSVKFDDAKPAPLDQIKPGDQLRARGTRIADGAEFTADEIVSGTFRNIAGVISALDASAGTVTVQDLARNKSVTVKITADSQLRKLPPPLAQRIAARLKGTPAEARSTATTAGGASAASNSEPSAKPNGPPSMGFGAGGMGRSGGGGGSGDLQQAISRMPLAALADLQKGDAVMVVATEGGTNGVPTVITLLGGVEPILEASPKSSASTILSPWSLGTGAGGEVATP